MSVAAARAQAVQLDGAAIDPKSLQPRSLPVEPHVHLSKIDVPHSAAALAQEMMVVIRIGLELSRGTAPLQRPDETGAHQLLHVAIHGRMRDGRQHFPDSFHQVVGGRVTGRLAERAQQDLPLRGQPQAARLAGLSQLSVPVADRSHRHCRKSTLASPARQCPT